MNSARRVGIALLGFLSIATTHCDRAAEPDEVAAIEVSSTQQALVSTQPDPSCTGREFGGHEYWFCTVRVGWQAAHQSCQDAELELVRIDGQAENDFIAGLIGDDRWIGGAAAAGAGNWKWTAGDDQFWTGGSGGPISGHFVSWASGQPSTQECLQIEPDGKWSADTCTEIEEYICETPTDCSGAPTTDSDGDGVTDCNDGCPADGAKAQPGMCGCGVPDVDVDLNGRVDCAPDENCVRRSLGGSEYWFCYEHETWADAAEKCQDAELELARIDDQAENDLISGFHIDDMWIGGTDVAGDGKWTWGIGGDQFWAGGSDGPISGHYENWNSAHPNSQGCLQVLPDGEWLADNCNDPEEYVCERPVDCSSAPGTDSDADGVTDCNDGCPHDAGKVTPGMCGCGTPDVDVDGNGIVDCMPGEECHRRSFEGSEYWFCDDHEEWGVAQAKCEAIGAQLARIYREEQNNYVGSFIKDDTWIGGSDSEEEGVWRWRDGQRFWSGGSNGTDFGFYENWRPAQPGGKDCLQMFPDGDWEADNCADPEEYVCESIADVSFKECLKEATRTEGPEEDRTVGHFEAVAACSSVGDPTSTGCIQAVLGRVMFDRNILARRVVAGTALPAEHVALARDRGRKVQLAHEDLELACEIARADADNDLVPDAVDYCPDTPELTATTDDGCADPVLPKGAPADGVSQLLNEHGYVFMRSVNCDGSPRPNMVRPVLVGQRMGGLILAFERVTNVAADCEITYLVHADISTFQSGAVINEFFTMAFVERENQSALSGCVGPDDDLGCSDAPSICDDSHVVFTIPADATDPNLAGFRDRFRTVEGPGDAYLRWMSLSVRPVDGSGRHPVWSDAIVPSVKICSPR